MKTVLKYIAIIFVTALCEGLIVGVYEALSQGKADWSADIGGSIAYALVIHMWLYIVPVSVFVFINNRLRGSRNQLFQQVVLGMIVAAITGCLSFPQLYRLNWLSALLCVPIGVIWGILHWRFITLPATIKE